MPNAAETVEAPYAAAERLTFLPQPAKEMVEYKHLNGSPALWTLLSLIPLANLYAEYKQGEAVEAPTDSGINRWIIFILWLIFSPAVWFIVQTELNKRASEPA